MQKKKKILFKTYWAFTYRLLSQFISRKISLKEVGRGSVRAVSIEGLKGMHVRVNNGGLAERPRLRRTHE